MPQPGGSAINSYLPYPPGGNFPQPYGMGATSSYGGSGYPPYPPASSAATGAAAGPGYPPYSNVGGGYPPAPGTGYNTNYVRTESLWEGEINL